MPGYSLRMISQGKPQLWSEQKNVVRDGVSAIEGGERVQVDDSEKVEEQIIRRGVLLSSNCLYCGKQWKGLVDWSEIACFYLGQPVPQTKAFRQGVAWPSPCRCGKASPLIIGWDDVARWVDTGVQTKCLTPNIYAAARDRQGPKKKG